MKITGRNIKRRLYGLRNLPSHLKRARYWRGHGVHSPFVYNIVRQVFMCREFKSDNKELYNTLLQHDLAPKRCLQLQNLLTHCNYTSWDLDCPIEQIAQHDIVIASLDATADTLQAMADAARNGATTLCILQPAYDRERQAICKMLVENHPCTSVDNRGYLLLFNNHLPKQIFKL